jgi:hypothetical protein
MITISKEYIISARDNGCFADRQYCQHVRYHYKQYYNYLEKLILKLLHCPIEQKEYWYCSLFGGVHLDVKPGLKYCPQRCNGCLLAEKKEICPIESK